VVDGCVDGGWMCGSNMWRLVNDCEIAVGGWWLVDG
jgi:hypothetical protein